MKYIKGYGKSRYLLQFKEGMDTDTVLSKISEFIGCYNSIEVHLQIAEPRDKEDYETAEYIKEKLKGIGINEVAVM